jgi:hypothetical protein
VESRIYAIEATAHDAGVLAAAVHVVPRQGGSDRTRQDGWDDQRHHAIFITAFSLLTNF